jgi:hypothetical protein
VTSLRTRDLCGAKSAQRLGWPKSQTSTRVGPAAVKYHNLKGGYGLNLFTGDNERQPNLIALETMRGKG